MVDYKKQGQKNRASGGAFELRTRKDLESKNWIVDKWSNNVEFDTAILSSADSKESVRKEHRFGKIIPAKRKYAGPGRPLAIGTGFPDFIAIYNAILPYKTIRDINPLKEDTPVLCSLVIGVECKTNGNLDKIEKEKCRWYLDNNIFSKILIAEKTKVKNRVVIVYHDFEEKYGI